MSDYYSSSIAASSTTANACTSTRWLTEEVFALIELVQRNEAIYNTRHKYYFCRPYVENFWREVDLKLEKNPGASLAKWTNLRISFRREYTNYLEEKVPPCWTYFDRMFFLHPYLRKKHQQTKSLDSQVQDALVQISSLSNRLQRERAAAYSGNEKSLASHNINSTSPAQPHQLDNYLEYLDEAEPNASELDDIIEENASAHRQQFVHSTLANDIKSECEDNPDEYETEHSHQHLNNAEDEAEPETEQDDQDLRCFILGTMEKRQQQQQRIQHLQRLQTRTFYDEFRAKRAKSQDGYMPTLNITTIASSNNPNTNNNVSFVRPTFAKPLDSVSTTTQSAANINNSLSSNLANSSDVETNATRNSTSFYHNHFGHSPHNQQHHHHTNRFELSGLTTNSNNSTTANVTTASNLLGSSAVSSPELCDCKTDPDAMFLMSLLPDIQKLNGRDRGKIKIAFQNILQDYLYPD